MSDEIEKIRLARNAAYASHLKNYYLSLLKEKQIKQAKKKIADTETPHSDNSTAH